ncbi:hypothetical protein [Vallitalea guaymasensis]|uniref:Uncharacterized protein n=1 Tax=Vallitalea guaymasensis TaxID=1185412 RepID=A0A8J8M928_9FIRM|nr:hypothetical protein [Vallitalea guaymasensis]QUH28602.1 hypothetical protein HYG85_06580 [Vallitalea guaymasensis]
MATYLDYYNNHLSPKLQKIDLFLKTEEKDVIDMDVVSELLDISNHEIKKIMRNNDIDSITKHSFIMIMFYGSSDICKLFSREVKQKVPNSYSPLDISYIYQLPYESVIQAAEEASIENITTKNINKLFSYIYV